MTTKWTPDALEREVEALKTGQQMESLLEELTADPAHASRLFEDLLKRNRSFAVRSWVPWAARNTLGPEAVPLLLRLARDRDPDMRDIAIEELLEIDPQAARSLAPALRRKLQSREFFEPITAMWALAEIGDSSAREAILEAAANWDNARHRNTAEVATILLGDAPNEILDRMRAHDHRMMPWLAPAARVLGTEEAERVLGECAESAPDERCKRICEEQLGRLRKRRERRPVTQ